MTKNIGIKDKLYSELKQMKGDRSFSFAIEQLIKTKPVISPAKDQSQAAAHNAVTRSEGNV